MGIFKRDRGPVTDVERRAVLDLATDEDFTLYEVLERFQKLGARDPWTLAQLTVLELLGKQMIEIHRRHPGGRRDLVPGGEAVEAVKGRNAWQPRQPNEPHLAVVATDAGWRWHQKHWKA